MQAFVQLWAFGQVVEVTRGNMSNRGAFELAQMSLVLTAALLPRAKWARVLAFSSRAACVVLRLPFVWDGEFLTLLTGAAVVGHALLGDGDKELGTTVRWQLAVFYFFAGFWKLNTAFLDPRYSCSSVYFIQIFDAYLPSAWLTQWTATFAASLAPPATICLECGLGTAFFLGAFLGPLRKQSLGKLGVLMALMLHLAISLTPKPNNIAGFSIECAPLYYFFVPGGAERSVEEAKRRPLAVGGAHIAFAAVIMALSIERQSGWPALFEEAGSRGYVNAVDWGVSIYSVFFTVFLRSLYLDDQGSSPASSQPRSKKSVAHRFLRALLLCCTLLWALTPLFGLMDIASPNMFSNLRQQGGSNHLFLPTSIMQRRRELDADSVFAGGVVRVESTDSKHIQGHFPAELNSVLTPRTYELLRGMGHKGIWNSAVGRVVGAFAIPYPAQFTKFTLPAYEFRRLLKEAERPFQITYTQLLSTGDAPTVRLGYGEAVSTCAIVEGDQPCTTAELALLQPIPEPDFENRPFEFLFGYAQTWNSYVVPDPNDEQLHCYGS